MQLFLLIIAVLNTGFGAEEHAFQQFIGCSFNNDGQQGHFWRYGYDGKDIMHVDLVEEAVVATSELGQLLADQRQSKAYIKRKEARLEKVCSVVKTVFLQSNNTLSKAARPSVYVSSGWGYLKCVVYGFYPNVIRVRWTHNGRPVYFGVSTTGVLPHRDGTFQMTSYLSLSNLTAPEVTCEIEHLSIDGKLRRIYGEKSWFLSQIALAVVAFVIGFALPVCLIIWKRRHKPKPPEDETNAASNESDVSLSLNPLSISQ